MKRIIALLIITVLCFCALTSCEVVDTVKGWFGAGEEPVEGPSLEEASSYLNDIYKDKDKETITNFDVVGKIIMNGVSFNVTWTVDDERITINPSTKLGYYTVTVLDKNSAAFDYTLTATITNADGESIERTFTFTMPEVNRCTIPEAIAAEDGTKVIVSGTVVRIDTAWNDGYKNMTVTIEDEDGNQLYVYRIGTKVALGDVITITGEIGSYNGNKQIVQGATAVIDDHVNLDIAYTEMTIPEVLAAEDGTAVKVSGTVTKINDEWSADYQNITVTISDDAGNTLYVYRLGTNVALGDVITISGYVGSYNGAKQIAQGATAEITGHEDIGGGETPDPTPDTSIGVVAAPVAGTAYKFGMVQGNLNKTYYLKGGMDGFYMATTEDASAALDVYLEETTGGYYLYILDGETKTYINMVVSSDGAHVNGAYEATASTVYTYNTESKTIIAVVNEVEYWFGTRNDKTYTTVGPCEVSYAGFYCQFYGEVEGGEDVGGGETPETPAEPETITIPKANQIADGKAHNTYTDVKYIVVGYINAVKNVEKGELLIIDDNGNTITIYGCYNADGTVAFSAMEDAPKAGDKITVLGVVGKYGSTNQIKDAWITDVVAHGECTFSEATCLLPSVCVCGAINAEALGHSYANGVCSRCGESESAISKTTSVKVGDTVYIVCDTKKFEFSAFSNTSTIYGTGVEYTDTINGVCAWTLEAGSAEGSFAFKNADGKYLTWTSGNSAKSSDSITANSSWNITFDANGNAIITNVADSTRQLQWNASSPRFAAYTSTQTAIQLYK